MERDFAYFQRGVAEQFGTTSGLASTSRFLNNPTLRDWLSTNFLRRNGPDLPIPSDPTRGLVQALNEIRDMDRVQGLIDAEKIVNPAFRNWVEEKWLGSLTQDDFARYPEGTFGNRYFDCMTRFGIQYNFGWKDAKPNSDFEFIMMRFAQMHDFEHLITGGGFNTLGELLPYFVRLSNPYTHLSPELATALGEIYLFGAHRLTFRAYLHYPDTWMTCIDLMQRGFRIGTSSEPFILMRFEEVLHLSLSEAREALGARHAEDIDTEAVSAIFDREAVSKVAVSADRPDPR